MRFHASDNHDKGRQLRAPETSGASGRSQPDGYWDTGSGLGDDPKPSPILSVRSQITPDNSGVGKG